MKIDQYESQFKRAVRDKYTFEDIRLERAALISNAEKAQAEDLKELVSRFLPRKFGGIDWRVVDRGALGSVRALVESLEEFCPNLIVAERSLEAGDESLVYGLSNYVDALTQVCTAPVLLLPDRTLDELRTQLRNCSEVMVETDHLTGDSRLINWSSSFVQDNGTLFLIHIEDERAFFHYMGAISQIADIDTDTAKESLQKQLLGEPRQFIEQARSVLAKHHPSLAVEGIVKLGRSLADYRSLLDQHQIDLLVLNTKKDGQLAMGGLAYAIAVEFKHVPLLLL